MHESALTRAARKDDHLRLATEQHAKIKQNDFDNLDFLHHALDTIDIAAVQLNTSVADWQWSLPFYINGMTGGTELTGKINRDLAIAARETGIAMASGSVSVALDADDASVTRAFTVIRDENPNGFVMANIGVDRSADDAKRAVDLLQADALQVHLNALQEIAMPEGSTEFSHWRASLAAIIDACPVPVIVKEVGFGISRRTIAQIAELGGQIVDVNGKGGTDFLSIESSRHTDAAHSLAMLTGFGQSALACLLDAPLNGPHLLASGGVRNAYDVAKALACGANAVGVAGSFLHTVQTAGAAALIAVINQWQTQLTQILALLGASTPQQLQHSDVLVRGELADYCRTRGIDISALSRRSNATQA